MPLGGLFDGFVEHTKRVSPICPRQRVPAIRAQPLQRADQLCEPAGVLARLTARGDYQATSRGLIHER